MSGSDASTGFLHKIIRVAGSLASSIRTKIVLPYAVLTLAVAAVGTFVVTQLVAGSLEERFVNQLVESGRVASDSVARKEREHLEVLRAMAFTQGVDVAMASGDMHTLGELLVPLAVNHQMDSVEVTDNLGKELLGFRHDKGSDDVRDYTLTTSTDLSTWPIVTQILAGQVDQLGDKFVMFVREPSGYYLFYTGGPVRYEDEVVGAILVGTYLDELLAEIKQETLADVTFYDNQGQVLAMTFRGGGEQVRDILQVPPAFCQSIVARPDETFHRSLTLYGRPYEMVFGPLEIRKGLMGIFSVALPSTFIVQKAATSRLQFGLLFTSAMVLVFVIGYLISRRIIVPIIRLVQTSRAVAAGDLSQQTGIRSGDEIGILASSFDQMTQSLRERTRELEEEATKVRAILESIADGVIVEDKIGQIIMMNPAAERILGSMSEGFPIHPIRELPPIHAEGEPSSDSSEARWFEASGRVISAREALVTTKDGVELGKVVVFRDITREVEVDRRMAEFIENLESVSYELRTPLTSIKGYSELLMLTAKDKLDEQQRKSLSYISQRSSQVVTMVSEFLDMTDIAAGILELGLARTSLDEMILEVMDSWRERIEEKQLTVIAQLPDDLPQVLVDRDRVKRVLHNLISNAYNYTMPGGNITVTTYTDGDKVRVDVADTGVGISEPDQSRLFTRFFRAREVPHDDVRGAGLGLYMAKALIEAHGEHIWLERSEPGEGSVFSFTLPIAEPIEVELALGAGESMPLVASSRVTEKLRALDKKPETLLSVLYTFIREGAKTEELLSLQEHLEERGHRVAADIVRNYYLLLSRPKTSADHLQDLIKALVEDDALEHGREVQDLYEGCLAALEVNSVARITTFHWPISRPDSFLAPAAQALTGLSAVAEALIKYERVEGFRDKVAYLTEALKRLGERERGIEEQLANPERLILREIVAHWRTIVGNALQEIRSSAQLRIKLVTKQISSQAPAALALEVHNIGPSPASNLRAKLMAGSGYRSLEDTATIDVLPVGERRQLRFSVQPVAKDEFRVQFRLAYDDSEREGKEEIYGDLVRLFTPPQKFMYIPNPYTPGTPLQPGNPLFVGRQDTFDYVRENISGLFRSNILVLIGQRRTGKTSLLKQLPARLAGEGYISVYIDGQSLGIDPGMANFFHQLSWEITDALEEEGLEVEPPSLEELSDNPRAVFEREFMAQVEKAIGERQLLFLLDEFETLEERVREGRLDPALFPYLRHLMQERDKLAFIFVGTHKIEEMAADYWSVLFNIALYRPIGFLDEAAAHRLITEPVREYNMIYDDLAVDKMRRATAGHPYFLQLLCHSLVKIHNSQRCNYITVREVSQALEEIVTAGEAHFIFLWKDAKPNDQLVMAALARVLAKEGRATSSQVVNLLTDYGVRLETRQVTEALRQLAAREIVRETGGDTPHYDFRVDLIRLWLEQTKSLSRVIEEVT